MTTAIAIAMLPAGAVFAMPGASSGIPDPSGTPGPAGTLALVSPEVESALAPELDAVHFVAECPPGPRRLEAVQYRPRSYRHVPAYSRAPSPVQCHGGAFSPSEDGAPTSVDFGLRAGPMVSDQVQIGVAADWIYNHEDQRTVTGPPYQQSGTTIAPERVLSQSSMHLFPMMGFLQVSFPGAPIVPYGGIGGGYEVLYLTSEDFQTQAHYDATFGGWGWQAWAGAMIPASGQVRLAGEVFVNQSNVEREVEDISGQRYLERVDVNGAGVRVGLNVGF